MFQLSRGFALAFLGLLFFGCAGSGSAVKSENRASQVGSASPLSKIKLSPSGAPSKVYFASFESVWRALQLSVRYPIAVNNMDEGFLITDWTREVDGYQPPHEKRSGRAGVRYRLQAQAIRGRVGGRASVKVIIEKQVQRMADFFSTPSTLPSDLIEEKVLLYRIGRELDIEEGLMALPQN